MKKRRNRFGIVVGCASPGIAAQPESHRTIGGRRFCGQDGHSGTRIDGARRNCRNRRPANGLGCGRTAISRRPVTLDSPVSFRRVPRLALLVLFLLSSMLFASPQALSAVFVKNFGQSASDDLRFVQDVAQGFSTGDHAPGYTLTSVHLFLSIATASPDVPVFSVAIWSESGGTPNQLVGSLTPNSATLTAGGNQFNAPETGLDLEANTTYFIVADVSTTGDRVGWSGTSSNNEDTDRITSGFEIRDSSLRRNADDSGAWTALTAVRKMRSDGENKTAVSTPTFAIAGAMADEGDDITFTVTLNPAASEEVTVDYATSVETGDTAAQADFTANSGTLTFVTGDTSKTFTVATLQDSIDETDETFTVTLSSVSPASAASLPADVTATGTIIDDDSSSVLSIADASADEGDSATFTVTLNPAVTAEVTVDYATSVETGDTAAQADFTANNGTLTFDAGDTTKTFTVATLEDSVDEVDETFTVTLSSASGANLASDATATGTITDDDQSTLSIADAGADEGDDITFTVTLDPVSSRMEAVEYETVVESGDTAVQADFAESYGTLDFAAGDSSQTFTVATTEDTDIERDETFTVFLGKVTGTAQTVDDMAIGTIRNDDQAVLGIADAGADEGDDITFTVTLNPAAIDEVTVGYATSVASGDTAVQADFTANSGTLTFAVGETSKTFTVATAEETTIEPDETFTVTLSNASGAILPADPTATGTIGDDDTPRVSIASGGDVAQEGTAATFTLTMSPAAPTGGLTVNVTLAEVERRTLETGELAYDFVAAASEGMTTVDFAAGDTAATLTVPTVDDDLYEAEFGDDNLLRATLAAGAGYAVATGSGTAELTLRDGAARPVLSWKTAKVTVTEGTDRTADLELTLSHGLVGVFIAQFLDAEVGASPASRTNDYLWSNTLQFVTFAPGTIEGTLQVQILDDTQLEGTETFEVSMLIDGHLPVTAASERVILVDILDTDTMQLEPSAVSARVVEGDAIDIKIDITPSGACNFRGEYFVTVTPSGDTATLADADAVEQRFGPCDTTRTVSFATEEDTDVTANRALSFTLATKAGTDSRITVVTDNVVEVAVIDDDRHATGAPAITGTAQVGRKLTASPGTIADGDGLTGASYSYTWFRVDGATVTEITGTTGNGYTPVAADQGKTLKVRASFTDDEGFDEQRESAATATVATAPTTPTFGIADASAAEGESITFTVTLNPAAGAASTVAWATSVATGDTAAQADFTAGNGTLNFGVGDTSKTITVATVEDTASEADETFTVTLSSASSGTALPSDATATGTITDDDQAPLSIADASADEGDSATFTVTLNPAAAGAVTVDYATSVAASDTAAQSDFTAKNGTLTFAAGDTTESFTVATLEDSVDEVDETFTVTLSNASGATLPTDATATGTITDDDQAALAIVDAGADEGDDITFTVTLNPISSREVKVDWATSVESGDTAAQADFTAGSDTLTFAAGDSSKSFSVATVEDTTSEPDETFTVTLSDASEATLPADPTATGTIGDDDTPQVSIASGGDVAQEGAAATFTLTMSPAAPTGGLTVNVTLAEVEQRTLEAGELAYDFVAAASEGMTTVDFAAGDTAATLTVPTVDDDLYEAEFGDDNLLRATLAAGAGYAVAAGSGTAELTLRDGAARPVLAWKTTKVTVTEGTDTSAALVTTLSHGLVESVGFTLVSIPASASLNNDYLFTSSDEIAEFAPGTTEATVRPVILDDTQLEGTETFDVQFFNDLLYPVTLASERDIQVEILDPDTMQVEPSAVSARVVEGDAIQIKIDTTPSGICNYASEFFVTVTPSGDTATLADADAVERRFAPCASTQTVSFATEEDTDETANRALSFTVTTKAGTDSRITVVPDNVVEVAVIDDDAHATGAPAITGTAQVGRKLTASPGTIADGDGLTGASYTYTWIRVDGATETEITGTTGNGYTPVAADQGKTLKVRASFTDDEGFDEQRDSAATATVAAAPTTPTFGIADASAAEGESITFTVTLNPAAGAAATVGWATSVASGDTAAQADFTAGSGTLNFGVGDTSKTITVATVEDTTSEADETFTVTLSSASSGTVLPSDATATGTIGDDDTSRVSIASGGDVASEGAAATFTLTMSPAAPAGGLTVNVTVAEVERRTLEAGELAYDLVAAASEGMKTVTFAAGETSATLTVPTVDDDLYESGFGADNLLRATLAAGTGYAVAAGSGTAELTLRDGADQPVVSWKTAKVTVTEGVDANAALVLTLSHALVGEVAFTLIAVPSSASSGSDFTFVMEDADFAPGTTEVTTLVPIVDSPQHLEATEVFNILIAHAVASQPVAIPGTSSIQVEILDPDTMQLDPTAVSARVVEGDAIEITIDTLPSGICPHFGVFFVTVTPSGDTATLADADAVEQRFAPCVSTQTVSFATREDTDVTANRALSFTLATKAGTDSRITVVTANVVEVAVIDDDRHATGAPAITGTAEVGRKLTASPGTIADGDGLTGASYSYTWIRVDGVTETAITGTTGNGYTPVAADQGKTLKVRASFTDDEGFDEQRESAETATVAAAPTMPTFGITDASAAEGDAVTFTVTLNPAASAAATVAWATSVASGDTAVQADFTAGNGTLNFGVGDTSKTFTVATVEDTAVEPGETFTVTLSSASSGTALPSDATATGTVVNDDVIGAFTIADASAAEGDAVTFTVTHTPAATQQVTVDWATSVATGDTAAQTDFTAGSGTLTFAVGDTSKAFTVATVEDTGIESSETFTATLSNVGPTGAATLPADATATGTITDDDTPPVLSISVNNASIAEAAGASTVTISTGSGPTFASAQTITLALTGTATETGDYSIGSKSLTLAAGTSSVTTTVTAVDDNYDDDAETVVIAASNGSDDIGSQTITITDDDDPPAFSLIFQGNRTSASETGAESVSVTVSLGGSVFESEQTLSLEVSGTAREGVDYNLQAQVLTLFEGLNLVGTRLTVVDDNYDDDAETVVINVVHEGTTVATGTITITDDDDPPAFSLIVSDSAPSEAGEETSMLTVSLGSGSVFEFSESVSLEVSGTAGEKTDYNLDELALTITGSENMVSTTLTVVDDNYDDDAETVVIDVVHDDTTVATGTITITDDDDPPAFSLIVSDSTPSEAGEETSMLTVSLGDGSVFEFSESVIFELSGTAEEKGDYNLDELALTITGSENMVSTTLDVVDDNYDDDAETVVIDVVHDGTTVATGTITISDDDDAPVLSVTVNNASVAEAAGASTVTVSTGSGSTFEFEETITLTLGGTATTGDDYTIGSTSLTLPYGEDHDASEIATTITAVQDKIDDDAETIIVNAALGSGSSATAIGSATVTISDDDDAPEITFTVSDASISEAGGTSTVTVSTGNGSTFATAQTFPLALVPDTATEGADFTLLSNSLTLPAGTGITASSVATTVTAVQDRIDEADETILIDVIVPGGGGIAAPRQTVTITDDDAAPVLSLDVSSATIAEAAGASTVTVGTGAGSTFATDQTITLALGGTATVIDDYSIGATTLTLPAGVGTAAAEITTTVTAVDDDFFEGTTNERLTVTGSLGGTDFGAARIITITENELAPKLTLTFSDDSISEDGGSTTVTASVAPRTVDAFTVTFDVTPNAPATAADYELVGTLAFAALSATPTGTVTVTANNNRVDRPDKTVAVTATSSESYFRATDAVTLTLEDEDAAPAPVLEVSVSPIAEDAGASTVTVTTGAGSTFPEAQTVILSLTGSATETADYSFVSKSLTLPAGSGLDVSTVTTTITAVQDRIDDDAESVLIDAAIGGTAVGAQQSITITDDDAAPAPTIGVSPGAIGENGGISTVTVTTGTGSTYATDQAVTLTLSGTATATADYSVDTTLTLPAGVGLAAASVETTATGVDDIIDDDAETLLIDAAIGQAAVGTQQSITITDDDAAPVLVFTALPTSIAENGGVSMVAVGTGTGSTYATDQTITLAVAGTAIEDADYTIGSKSLTLPAGVGSSAASVETPVTGLDDGLFEGEADQTVVVTATHAGAAVGSARTIAVVDDEANSQVTLVLTPDSIPEADVSGTSVRDHISQISATVSPPAEHAFVVDLEIEPNAPATAADYTTALPVPSIGLLDFTAGATQSTGLAFITAQDNDLDTPDKTLTVSGAISGFDHGSLTLAPAATTGILAPAAATLTIRDDDLAPGTVALSVDLSAVAEDAGAISIEVTATLATGVRESDVEVTLTLGGGTGDDGAASGIDFEPVADFGLTIAANETSGRATFTLTPLEDRVDEPDETLRLTGASADPLVGVPEAVAIAITDNDDAPAPEFTVLPAGIAENGGTATVTVTTGTGSTFAGEQTITLSVSGTATADTDYTISSRSLTLPAGAGTELSSVTATITAIDDNLDDDAETIVLGALLDGAALGDEQTVTITDDEGTPQVTLTLTPPSIAEDGGASTVTATVSPAAAAAFTVTVASAPVSPADAGDFAQSGSTLSFASGATTSTGSVTITAVDNTADTPDHQVLVSGTVSSAGVSAPAGALLTILDDDSAAVLSLQVEPSSIDEDGGAATVTVTTGTGSTFDTGQVITLVLEGTATQDDDYTISATQLTLPAGASSVTATVTGLDDDIFEGDETVLISGLHAGESFGAGLTLTITDDEAAPAVTLVLTPDSIGEDGGTATVTATVSAASPEPFSVTVAFEPDAPAVAEDFVVSGATLSFAANTTESTGEVTIAAVDNDVDAPDKTLRVSGTVSRVDVTAPAEATLTIVDDDEASSTVTLSVTPDRIDEGAPATQIEVTGMLDSGARDADTVISLSLGGGAAAASPGVDYEPVADFNLTIPANETSATAMFTLTPLEDRIDEADEAVILTGSAGSAGIGVPETVEIAVADNDDAPVLALGVDPAMIAENGGTATVTVTTGEGSTFEDERTIELDVAGTATQDEDYRLQAATLTLPAGAGTEASTATVTLTGLDDGIAEADETIILGGTVDGVAFGTQQTVTIEDDEGAPRVTLLLTPGSIGEHAGVSTVTATVSPASSEAFTVTVAAAAVAPAVSGDFTLSGATLNFAADATDSTGEVTITAVDNDEDAPDKTVTVSGTVSLEGVTAPPDATLTITDDEVAAGPAVTLVLTPALVGENGGVSTVTATVSPASSEAFTVTVAAAAVAPAVSGDFTLSGATLNFAADATDSTGAVTLTAVDNDEDAPDKTVTVSGTVSLEGVTAPPDVTLTITDDEVAAGPAVTLVLTPGSIDENAGVSTVTATVSPASSEAFTVTVAAAAVDNDEDAPDKTVTVSPAVSGDFTLSGATLSFAADATDSTGAVTITAVDNDEDAPDKTVTVSGTVSLEGVTAPPDATLTITDDEVAEGPAVTLVLTPGPGWRERRGEHGDGDGLAGFERGLYGDGCGCGGGPGGVGRLYAERRDAEFCGRCDGQHRRGDDHGGGQRRGRAGQDGDGLRHGVAGGRDRAAGCDADDHRRRSCRGPCGDAGADAGPGWRERRGEHGDGDGLAGFERGLYGDGCGCGGGPGGVGRLYAERRDAEFCGRCDGQHRRGDDHGGGQRRGRAGQDGDGLRHRVAGGRDRAAGCDADDHRRRSCRGLCGDAGADAGPGW